MRRKTPTDAPVPVHREPWEVKAYREAEHLIRKVWDLHSRPRIGGSFGSSLFGQSFYCESCSAPWPCATFQLVADFGTLNDHPNGYEPLRLIPREPSQETAPDDEAPE
jgi:hypothetical protein